MLACTLYAAREQDTYGRLHYSLLEPVGPEFVLIDHMAEVPHFNHTSSISAVFSVDDAFNEGLACLLFLVSDSTVAEYSSSYHETSPDSKARLRARRLPSTCMSDARS